MIEGEKLMADVVYMNVGGRAVTENRAFISLWPATLLTGSTADVFRGMPRDWTEDRQGLR